MLVPGFPSISIQELLASKQPQESLPFPLKQEWLTNHDACLKNTKSETQTASRYPLNTKNYFYFFARNGIYHGLKSFRIQPGDEVLMPELNSTIEPQVVRALGAIPVFYRILTTSPLSRPSERRDAILNPPLPFSKDFTPDWDDVRSKLTVKTKSFHLIHYLGVPNDIDTALEVCKKNNLIFFEDAAYGFLSSFSSTSTSHTPLGSHGDFSILCPRKTIPVPNGGILVMNHQTRNMEHKIKKQHTPFPMPRASLRASYSSLWDWQFLLRNNASDVIPGFDPVFKKNKKQKIKNWKTPLRYALNAIRSVTGYVFHGSAEFNIKHVNWSMTRLAYNQLFTFDYQSIIQKNLENYARVRDFCVNRGWDIFPREIRPGAVPNAILLKLPSAMKNLKLKMSHLSNTNNEPGLNNADTISDTMKHYGIELARPWRWNENLTILKDVPSVNAYVGRGLILPIHYQLSRDHLDHYLSLLSSIIP